MLRDPHDLYILLFTALCNALPLSVVVACHLLLNKLNVCDYVCMIILHKTVVIISLEALP